MRKSRYFIYFLILGCASYKLLKGEMFWREIKDCVYKMCFSSQKWSVNPHRISEISRFTVFEHLNGGQLFAKRNYCVFRFTWTAIPVLFEHLRSTHRWLVDFYLKCSSGVNGRQCFSHWFSLQFDPVSVVHQAVEDGIGQRVVTDGLIPLVDR